MLAGPRQTINRCELSAFGHFLAATVGPAVFVTASLYVLRGWRRLRLGKQPATNEDLWRWVAEVAGDRAVRVIKIESHMPSESVLGSHDLRFWIGNLMADAVAAELAQLAAVPRAAVTALRAQEEIAAMVALRATAILMRCMQVDPLRQRLPRPREVRAVRIGALLRDTSHTLAAHEGARSRTYCAACGERPSRRGLARWLRAPFSRPC